MKDNSEAKQTGLGLCQTWVDPMTFSHHIKLNIVLKVYTHESYSTLTANLEVGAPIIYIFTDKTNSENLTMSQDHTGHK